MIEKIGEVTIDDTYYGGKDLYCDGPVEDELLEIVQNYDGFEYKQIIEEKKSWPIFYHLSDIRQNIVKWINMTGKEKVLEIGSGCGAITGALSDGAKLVDCIELSKKRSLINAYRNASRDNINIRLGNFQDIEPNLPNDYDYIFLIGVLEYAISYIGGEKPFEDFIRIIRKHLRFGGQIVIAIENRMGMKYLAGCKEDHLSSYFAGVEGYPQGGVVRTFTKPALERLLWDAGVEREKIHFYYPYPDYKFMTTLFSDKRLPAEGELTENMRNFDADRLLLFDEKEAFDAAIRDKDFPYFSNSFLVVIGDERENVYVKYSNDRAAEYCICTSIIEDVYSQTMDKHPARMVIKYPIYEASEDHISKLYDSFTQLSSQYDSKKLKFNNCAMNGKVAVLDYIWGQTLEQKLDELSARDDKEGFVSLVREYMDRITPKMESEDASSIEKLEASASEQIESEPETMINEVAANEGQTSTIQAEAEKQTEDLADDAIADEGQSDDTVSSKEQQAEEKPDEISLEEEKLKKAIPLYNEDLIFPNILIEGRDWTVIDYEWVTVNPISVEDMTARALFCYSLGSPTRKKMAMYALKTILDFTQSDYNRVAKQEAKFQARATGDSMSLTDLRHEFGRPIIPITKLAHDYMNAEHRMRIQIYEDHGKGLSEEDSYFLHIAYEEGKAVDLDIEVETDIEHLRIDPCMDNCLVKLEFIEVENVVLTLKDKAIHHNGYILGADTIIFDTEDPWIQINFTKSLKKKLKKVNGDIAAVSVRARFVTNRLPIEMIDTIIGKKK